MKYAERASKFYTCTPDTQTKQKLNNFFSQLNGEGKSNGVENRIDELIENIIKTCEPCATHYKVENIRKFSIQRSIEFNQTTAIDLIE